MSKNPYNITQYRNASIEKHKTRKKSEQGSSIGTKSVETVKEKSIVNHKEKKPKKKYTVEEIEDKLSNYVEIPQSEWKTIPRKTYIKFFKAKEGNPEFSIQNYKDEFDNYGGFIRFINTSNYEDGTSQWVFGLGWSIAYNSKYRVVPFSDVKSVWRKMTLQSLSGVSIPVENQSVLQRQILELQKELDEFRKESDDKTDDLKSAIVKLRNDVEDLVGEVAKKIMQR